MAYWHWV